MYATILRPLDWYEGWCNKVRRVIVVTVPATTTAMHFLWIVASFCYFLVSVRDKYPISREVRSSCFCDTKPPLESHTRRCCLFIGPSHVGVLVLADLSVAFSGSLLPPFWASSEIGARWAAMFVALCRSVLWLLRGSEWNGEICCKCSRRISVRSDQWGHLVCVLLQLSPWIVPAIRIVQRIRKINLFREERALLQRQCDSCILKQNQYLFQVLHMTVYDFCKGHDIVEVHQGWLLFHWQEDEVRRLMNIVGAF